MHVSDQHAFPLHMPPNCLVKKELRTFMLVWHQTMAVTAQQYYRHVAFCGLPVSRRFTNSSLLSFIMFLPAPSPPLDSLLRCYQINVSAL